MEDEVNNTFLAVWVRKGWLLERMYILSQKYLLYNTARNTRTIYKKHVMCFSLQRKKRSYFLHTTDDVNQVCYAHNLLLISFSYLKRLCLRRNISPLISMCLLFMCSYVFMKGRVFLVIKKFTSFPMSDWSRQRVLNYLWSAIPCFLTVVWFDSSLNPSPPLPSYSKCRKTEKKWQHAQGGGG